MRAFLSIVLLFSVLFTGKPAVANFTPARIIQECRDVNLRIEASPEVLRVYGVDPLEDWEILAIDSICRGCLSSKEGVGRSKNLADMTQYGDVGLFHFNEFWQRHFGWQQRFDDDLEMLAFLNSESSFAVQLTVWRTETIAGSVRRARNQGWEDEELALAAAIGNSSPRDLQEYGAQCDWEPNCVADMYASESLHRQRRISWLESHIPGGRWD